MCREKKDPRASSGKFSRGICCYPESFRFLCLWLLHCCIGKGTKCKRKRVWTKHKYLIIHTWYLTAIEIGRMKKMVPNTWVKENISLSDQGCLHLNNSSELDSVTISLFVQRKQWDKQAGLIKAVCTSISQAAKLISVEIRLLSFLLWRSLSLIPGSKKLLFWCLILESMKMKQILKF